MSSSQIYKQFERISSDAEKTNAKNKNKRLQVMTHSVSNRVVEVGIYDTKTKQYALTDVRAYNAEDTLKEMEKLISLAKGH